MANILEDEQMKVPEILPMLPVRDTVIFPYMILPLFVGRESSIKAVDVALAKDRMIFLATQKVSTDDNPTPESIYSVGTAAMVMKMLKLPDGRVKILGAELLTRIGANRFIKNFRHIPNLFPPRFSYAGGKYTLIQPFTSSSGTKGTVFSVNPSWRTALYERAFIPTPYVIKSHIVRPVNRVGDLSWQPTNYMGEWQWVTGAYKLDVDCADPLEKKGQHYAEFVHAVEPVFTNQGMTIIFRRCTGALTTIICS